ncbi:MAG: ATP-binding protein, partial [Actinomycetota bacterium]|nr:ATP-binding protein [Actinomycetota bacterium]
MRSAAELTLGREPDAVPKARRFVGLCLGSEPVGTVQDIQLAVTELVTNALLHGEPPVAVRLIRQDTTIRIEVEDTGRNLPMQPIHDPDAMTGRGLALVGALSTAWGVDAGSRPGKVVWAELDADRAASTIAGPPEIAAEALAASRAERPGSPVHQVRLGGVPTDLLLAAKAHMDNVVRELTLLRGGRSADGTPLPPAMSALVDTVTG